MGDQASLRRRKRESRRGGGTLPNGEWPWEKECLPREKKEKEERSRIGIRKRGEHMARRFQGKGERGREKQ